MGRQNRKKRRRSNIKRKNRNWIRLLVALIALPVIAYFLFFNNSDVSESESLTPSSGGILGVLIPVYDFGEVSMKKGVVTTQIPISNLGNHDLKINGLDSSCGCTRASIINGGVEGPIFQMGSHGKNPKNWKTTIMPGGAAFLKVYYDPTVHPNLKGTLTRIITIYSDDPKKPIQRVKIKVNQIA